VLGTVHFEKTLAAARFSGREAAKAEAAQAATVAATEKRMIKG
jgi:hypothetical protein